MRLKWWYWPLIGLTIILAILAVVYAVGAALPEEHTATASAELDVEPDRVWRLLTDLDRYPAWRPDVDSVIRLDDRDGLPIWRETLGTGVITFETVARDSARLLVARIADEDLPFGGQWTYRLTPTDGGTRLTITEDGEIYHPFFRFMSRFVFGHETTLRSYLGAVREELEGP